MDTQGYQVNILSLPEEDGGGYIAIVPELPGCIADGRTPEEALNAAEDAIKTWIEIEKEDGGVIPSPQGYKAYSEYSGRIALRLPKWMHAKIALAAEKEGCSINQLIQNAIAFFFGTLERGIPKREDMAKESSSSVVFRGLIPKNRFMNNRLIDNISNRNHYFLNHSKIWENTIEDELWSKKIEDELWHKTIDDEINNF